jgi:hypothetical protein
MVVLHAFIHSLRLLPRLAFCVVCVGHLSIMLWSLLCFCLKFGIWSLRVSSPLLCRCHFTVCVQESIFTHGIFRNTVTIYGTAVSVAVMIIIVYAPFLQVRQAGSPVNQCLKPPAAALLQPEQVVQPSTA